MQTAHAVFFDVGATLIRPHPTMGEIYRRVLRPLGIEVQAEEFMRLFGVVWKELSDEIGEGRDRYSAFGDEMSYWRTYVGRVLARLGSGVPVDSATYALHGAFADPASWAVFPDVPETLAELRGRGLRLGIISNWDSRLPRLLQGLGLDSFFEPVVHSSRVGHEKPSPEIFQEALRQARARPEESIHVGDDFDADYRGAEAIGMVGVLLNRDGIAPKNVRSVASLGELPGLLRGGTEKA